MVDFTIQLQFQLYKDLNVCLNKITIFNQFSLEKIKINKKMKPLTLESHFIKSESFDQASLSCCNPCEIPRCFRFLKNQSFDQASLHAAILVGFLVQCLMIYCINAEHFKNRGTSLCSPISNRLVPQKNKNQKRKHKILESLM